MSTENQNTRNELEQLSLPQLQARFRELIGETTRCPNRRFLVRRIEEALAARQEQAPAEGERVIDEPAAEPASPQADTIEMTSVPTPEDNGHEDTIEMPSANLLEEADGPAASMEATSESTPDEAQPTVDSIETPAVPIAEEGERQAGTIETDAVSIADEGEQQPDTIEMTAVRIADEDDAQPGAIEPTLDADPPTPRQRGRFSSMTVEELQAKYLEVVGRPSGSSNVGYLVWKIREAEKGRITIGPRQAPERGGEPLDVKVLPLRLEAAVIDRMDEAWRARGIKSRMEFLRRAIGHYLTHVGANDAATMFVGAGND